MQAFRFVIIINLNQYIAVTFHKAEILNSLLHDDLKKLKPLQQML